MIEKIKPYIDAALQTAKEMINKGEEYIPTIYHVYENMGDNEKLSITLFLAADSMQDSKAKMALITKTHYEAYTKLHRDRERIISAFMVSDTYLSSYEVKEGEKYDRAKYPMPSDDPKRREGIMVLYTDNDSIETEYHEYERRPTGIEFTKKEMGGISEYSGLFTALFPNYIFALSQK